MTYTFNIFFLINRNDKHIIYIFRKNKGNKASITKKKKQIENEFDDLPPIEDLKISVPEVLCDPLGEVINI